MAELTIRIEKYIGDSYFDWETFDFFMATNADDVRMAVEYAKAQGELTGVTLEMGTCCGGSVYAAIEIYNYVRGLGVPVTSRVLALAASAATLLLLAGDEGKREMHQTSQLMTHAPSGGVDGTPDQVRDYLKGLEGCQQIIKEVYLAGTGQPAEVVDTWLSGDNWFTATEAAALGFCRVLPLAPATVASDAAPTAALKTRFATMVAKVNKADFSNRPPLAITPKPQMATNTTPKATPRAAAPATLTVAKPRTIAQKIMAALGLDDDTTEPTAVVESTTLANDSSIYHEGALAIDSAVFEDEALTVVPADGDYDLKDATTYEYLTVAAGLVTHLHPAATASAAADAPAETSVADLVKRIEALEADKSKDAGTITNLTAEVNKFKNMVPPTPAGGGNRPAPRAATPQTDAKASTGRGRGLLAGAVRPE